MTLRILQIVRALPSHRLGGLEFHTLDLANALAKRGHDVTILTSRDPEHRKGEKLVSGVQVRFMPQGRPGDYSMSFFRQAAKMAAEMDMQKPLDIIHGQEFATMFMGDLQERVVCTVHGTMFSETELDRRSLNHMSLSRKLRAAWNFKHRLVLHPFFVRMLRRSKRLLVDSDYTMRELLIIDSDLRDKIRKVPLGIDPLRYQLLNGPEKTNAVPVIASVGRLQEMKGVLVALAAARILESRGVRFLMKIGGSGPAIKKLQKLVVSQGLDDKVEICGRIDSADLPSFMAGADIFLFPDLTQPAFGLVAVEAMQFGVPVVAARSGAIPEVVTEETGWVYDPWNTAELAAVLQEAIGNTAGRTARGEAARKRAGLFTSDKMAEDFEKAVVD